MNARYSVGMSQENVEAIRRMYEDWARGEFSTEPLDATVEYVRIGAETPEMQGRWLGLDELSKAAIRKLAAS